MTKHRAKANPISQRRKRLEASLDDTYLFDLVSLKRDGLVPLRYRFVQNDLVALKVKGSSGVHLGTSPKNVRSERFYLEVSFHELKRREPFHLSWGEACGK